MAYYAIYETSNGRLVSQGTVIANPLPTGLTAVDIINPPADGYIWDAVLRTFIPPPAPRIIGKTVFIKRFTLAEQKEMFGFMYGTTYTAAQQKNLASLMRFMDFLDLIDLDDTTLVSGISYLTTVGILTAGRAAVVLA
jgi:hypothetical protein